MARPLREEFFFAASLSKLKTILIIMNFPLCGYRVALQEKLDNPGKSCMIRNLNIKTGKAEILRCLFCWSIKEARRGIGYYISQDIHLYCPQKNKYNTPKAASIILKMGGGGKCPPKGDYQGRGSRRNRQGSSPFFIRLFEGTSLL